MEELKQILAEKWNLNEKDFKGVNEKTNLKKHFGFDDLDLIETIMEIEMVKGISIDDDNLSEYDTLTIGGLIELVHLGLKNKN